MKRYATKQRSALGAFFESHADQQFTVEEIMAMLCKTKSISRSAVYRNINALVAQKTLQRFPVAGSRKFAYQYIGKEACKTHIHLKCEQCGRIVHLDNQTMDEIQNSLQKNSGFQVDKQKTIVYGLCKVCG